MNSKAMSLKARINNYAKKKNIILQHRLFFRIISI